MDSFAEIFVFFFGESKKHLLPFKFLFLFNENHAIWSLFFSFLSDFLFFVFFIVPSPICFSFWSASLFHNLIYIYCTETLWLTSLNLYCGAWIEDIWNVTLASDLHLWYPQLLARNLNPKSFISILFHCVSLCTCTHFLPALLPQLTSIHDSEFSISSAL